ncbi:MAG: hypothetical protein U1A78_37980 [Polyangia bacterium]
MSGFFALIVSAIFFYSNAACAEVVAETNAARAANDLLHRHITLDPAGLSVRQWSSSEKRWQWRQVTELPRAPVLFVHLWSVTCVPCVRELPFLAMMITKYKRLFGNRVDFLVMSYDETQKIDSFINSLGDRAPQNLYRFSMMDVERSLGTITLPMTLFVERNQLVVRQAFVGSIDTRESEVKPSLERLADLLAPRR